MTIQAKTQATKSNVNVNDSLSKKKISNSSISYANTGNKPLQYKDPDSLNKTTYKQTPSAKRFKSSINKHFVKDLIISEAKTLNVKISGISSTDSDDEDVFQSGDVKGLNGKSVKYVKLDSAYDSNIFNDIEETDFVSIQLIKMFSKIINTIVLNPELHIGK